MSAALWLLFSYILDEDDSRKIESNFTPQIVKDLKEKLRPEIVRVQRQIEKVNRSVAQTSEVDQASAEDFSSESYEKHRLKQILCFYRKNNIPFSDTSASLYNANMIFRTKDNSDDETQNYQLYVKSPDCQPPLYSRIDIQDDQGSVSIERNLDCNRTSKEELFLNSGFQQTISFIGDEDPKIKNLAISGDGYFVLACNDNHLHVTRKGNFHWNDDGILVSENNCALFGGIPSDGKIEMRAINRENIDNFQVLNLQASNIRNPRLLEKGNLQIDLLDPVFFPRESTTNQDASSIFENYIEGVDDPDVDELGLHKDMWQKEDMSISCSDADKYFRRIEQKDVSE